MSEQNDLTQDISFWKRLESFIENVEVNDAWADEEKQAFLYVCYRKIKEMSKVKCFVCGSTHDIKINPTNMVMFCDKHMPTE